MEAILLDKKEKKELEVERMALFAMLFTFVNFFAMLERFIIAVVIIGVLVLSIAIIVYEKKQKQQENEELSYYYERKVQELMLMYIMLIMPIVSVIIQLTYPSLARGYCAAIAGLIEILVVNLMIPNFINSRSTVYFEIGDSKYYIYKTSYIINDNTIELYIPYRVNGIWKMYYKLYNINDFYNSLE